MTAQCLTIAAFAWSTVANTFNDAAMATDVVVR